MNTGRARRRWACAVAVLAIALFAQSSNASAGDRLPEFRECTEVCERANCHPGGPIIPFHRRLLLWDCPAECDYACQHIVTDDRLKAGQSIEQFHGKWPFYRFLGIQEPFSVLFSLLNFLAHDWGMRKLQANVPASYPLRRYYMLFGWFGLGSWFFSMVFHTRDYNLTEKLDYFGAGWSVLYGLYYAVIRVFRLDQSEKEPWRGSVLRAWTLLCIVLYAAHVAYLTLVRWDYTYNMAANVVIGIIQNLLWSSFSIVRFRKVGRLWAAWPGLIVAWIIFAMTLELFDFAPFGMVLDAHALWHAGTVVPTVWWYNFLLKDAQEDLQGTDLSSKRS